MVGSLRKKIVDYNLPQNTEEVISEFHNMEQGLLFSSYLPLDEVVWQNVLILAKSGNCIAVQCKLSGQDWEIRAEAPNTERYQRTLTNNITFLQLNATSLHAILCAVTFASQEKLTVFSCTVLLACVGEGDVGPLQLTPYRKSMGTDRCKMHRDSCLGSLLWALRRYKKAAKFSFLYTHECGIAVCLICC